MTHDARILALARNDATVNAWLCVAERQNLTETQVLREMVVALAAQKQEFFERLVEATASAPFRPYKLLPPPTDSEQRG